MNVASGENTATLGSTIDRALRFTFALTGLCGIALLVVTLWEGAPGGPFATKIYAAVATSIVLASVSAFFGSFAFRANLMLVFVSVGFTTYMAEIALAVWPDSLRPLIVTPEDAARAAGRPFDTRTAVEVLTELRGRDPSAVITVTPYVWLREWRASGRPPFRLNNEPVFPLAGVGNRRTLFCNETGTWMSFPADRFGFRNPDSLWDEPSFDVAFVGDSFTHGSCVEDEQTIPGLVRRRYPRTANLGQIGNGPLTMLAAVKEYLPPKRPRVVVWNFYEGNDFPSDLSWEAKNPILPRYVEAGFSQHLMERHAEVNRMLAAYVEQRLARHDISPERNSPVAGPTPVRDTVLLRRLRGLLVPWHGDSPDYDLMRRTMAEAKRVVESWGGRLVFAYLPDHMRYLPMRSANSHRNAVLALVHELGIPVVDVHGAVFERAADPNIFFIYTESHYSEAGYAAAASAILPFLDRELGRQ